MGSTEPVASRRPRRGVPAIALALSAVAAGVLVWAVLDVTAPRRDRDLNTTASIAVGADAPGTADLRLSGVDAGGKGRIEVTVVSADDAPAEFRLFAAPDAGHFQSLAPLVDLSIDDLSDGKPPWTGTLDEFRSLVSSDAGILPIQLAPGERRRFVIHYDIPDDAPRSGRASVMLVWQAVP